MSHKITVRLAQPTDIPTICAIEDSATKRFASIPALTDLAQPSSDPSALTQILKTGRVFLAESILSSPDSARAVAETTVVGFASAAPLDGFIHLHEISVHLDHHGAGVGTRLLDAVCRWAEEVASVQDRQGSDDGERDDGASCGNVGAGKVSLITYGDGVPWNGPWYRRRGFREVEAGQLGIGHVGKMVEEERSGLGRVGFRRCCMLWSSDGREGNGRVVD